MYSSVSMITLSRNRLLSLNALRFLTFAVFIHLILFIFVSAPVYIDLIPSGSVISVAPGSISTRTAPMVHMPLVNGFFSANMEYAKALSLILATLLLLTISTDLQPSKAKLSICYAVFEALSLQKPILIEGDPGVGKTSLAIAVSKMLSLPFLRLQMYDGLTKDEILYDYDYQRQLLTLEAVKPKINEEIKGMDVNAAIRKVAGDVNFYGEEFLIPRPVLQTINGTGKKLLLIDEIDKSSEETEYMLYAVRSKHAGDIVLDKDFAKMNDAEKRQIADYIKDNARKFRTKMSRKIRANRSYKIDIPATIKKSCQTGGIPLRLIHQKPVRQKSSKQAWALSPDWPIDAAFGVMLGALAFWNGAVVVATLLILAGFAIMSSNKFDYVIMAVNAIALSFAQKRFFMPAGIASSMKDEMKTRFYFGFLADKQTAGGVVLYLIMLSGVFFLGVAVFLVIFKGKKRAMIAAFLFPVIFAFTVSMTPDIAVNHKYIIISTIFLNMIWAYALTRLWGSRNIFLRTLAVLLAITLTATGAYDLLTIYNADKRTLKIDMGSSLTEWLKENVKENDLVLTGEESMSEITLSGIMLYNGWPYYAWSAGYDTDTRAANAIEIYSSEDKEKVKELVKKEGIDYIIYEDGMMYEEHECSDEVIKKIYKCVFEKGDVKVYKVA